MGMMLKESVPITKKNKEIEDRVVFWPDWHKVHPAGLHNGEFWVAGRLL
jgi:hypothetical protein